MREVHTPASQGTRRTAQTGTARRTSKMESRRRAAQSARDLAANEAASARPLLPAEAAARYLGVSRWTIYRLIDRGELKAYTVGSQIRIRPDDIDAYLDAVAS